MKPFNDKITRATRQIVLMLLASFLLVSCGGGGDQSSSSTPSNTVNAVINQNGGAIALADGTSVTLVAGLVTDATQITVSTTPDPLTTLPSGTTAASPSVRIEIPANALQSNIPLGAGITIEIPVGTAIAAGVAITPGNALDAFKTVGVRISRGAQVSLGYAKYGVMTAANGTKNAAIWVGGEYLKLINVAGDVGGSAIVFVDVKVQNVQACFQGPELNKLYHVVQLPGQINSPDIYSAKDSLNFPLAQTVNPNKIPLVLIHGIQALDTCTNAYKGTWATFIANFYNTPELVSKYQLFTYSYDTSLAIRDETNGEGSGRNFAQSLLAVTGSKKAVVIAHSMGGLVSRSALIYEAAPIENLITLGTPHHGTPLRNIDELLIKAGVRNLVSNPKLAATALMSEVAWFLTLDVQGARQLDWDNFDSSILSCNLSAGQTCNKFIKDMNSIDSNLAQYSLFAGFIDFIDDPLLKISYANAGFPEGAGDLVVPKVSALFQDYATSNAPQYTDKPIFAGKTNIVSFSHMNIHGDPSWPLADPPNTNSVFATIQNLLLLPAAPTGISATAADSQATISWNAVAGVTYNLYKASISGVTKSNFSTLTHGMKLTGATSPYTDTGLTNGTTYYFVVTAVNAYGESIESSQVSATPQALALPVVTLTASPSSIANGATSTLSWSSTNSTSCFSLGGGGPGIVGIVGIVGIAGIFTTPPLTATTTYTVTCTGAGGTASQSATVTVAGTPASVGNLVDNFDGTAMQSAYWTPTGTAAAYGVNPPGAVSVLGGILSFGCHGRANTSGKYTFSGNQIVIESRFSGTVSPRDTFIALVDSSNEGDIIVVGDTSYGGYGLYAVASGVFNLLQEGNGNSVSAYKEYRLTLSGTSLTWERGDTLSNITETTTRTLGSSIAGKTFYLVIGTGGPDYCPGSFDWIRVVSNATPPPPTTKIAAGGHRTITLKADGTLWEWGWNVNGQLGDGTTIDKYIPTQIGTDTTWSAISAGYGHTTAIKTDGTLWAWGNNLHGQLGDGTTTDKTTPIQTGTATNWSAIAAGVYRTVALKTDGTLWVWGWNVYGQVGDGTTIDKYIPTQIGTDTTWSAISAETYYTIALKTDGTLWAWGNNATGDLGDGTTINRTTPTQIGTATNWSAIATGNSHTLAIKTDGTLWAWGDNVNGDLGDGTATPKYIPTQIGTATNWSAVAAGDYRSMALKTDGTLWAWGWNVYGQLGDGTWIDKTSPIQTGTATNWSAIAAGTSHSIALKTDGTLWVWGYNGTGPLGDGTTTNKNTPTQISF